MNSEAILNHKGHQVISVHLETPIMEAIQLLFDHHVGSAMVLDGHEQLCGVFSERDVVSAIAQDGVSVLDKSVSAIMSGNPISCGLHDSVEQLMSVMTQQRVRHLPVMEQDGLVGVVSIGDVVKVRIDQLEEESSHLRDYIATAG